MSKKSENLKADRTIKVLVVHGIGHMDEDDWWHASWENAINKRVAKVNTDVNLLFEFMSYDKYFEPIDKFGKFTQAPTLQRGERLAHAEEDEFSLKALLAAQYNWRVNMVTKFLTKPDLRDQLHDAFEAAVAHAKPDVVYCHSLGTLLAYSYFQKRGMNKQHPWVWVTAASQLAHKLLKKLMPDPLQIPNVKAWYNLNNPKDGVFANLDLKVAPNSTRTYASYPAPFEIVFLFNHDEPGYINKSPDAFWQKLIGHF